MSKHAVYHCLAILTVVIWGVTFISTKVLIHAGLMPVEIFLYRFILAYLCILTVAHKRLFAHTLKDETLLMLAGLCGGSIYFIAENTALGITLASNVSLIICTAPIITAFLTSWFYKEPLNRNLLAGSVIALLGVVASMLCYLMWNAAVKVLGTAQTTSYIYIIPLVTMVASAVLLNERPTIASVSGAGCIICGVYWAERKSS